MIFWISKAAWRLAEPDNLLLTAALVGAVLNLLSWRRLGRGLLGVALSIMLIVATVPLGGMALAVLEQRFPEPREVGPVDGIVVLGGGVNASGYFAHRGSGLNGGVTRIIEAARLADRYKSAKLLYSGGPRPTEAPDANEGRAALELFAALGVDPARITLDLDSRNTYENALFAERIAQPKAGEHWVLVTSAFHMPRAMGCFRAVNFPVTAFPVDFRFTGQGRLGPGLADGLADLDLAAHELTGLAAYRALGKTNALFPAP